MLVDVWVLFVVLLLLYLPFPALLLIAKEQDILKGIIMMILYSIGLGLPFIISAILIERLKNVFDFIKKHYNVIKKISGVILIIAGIYMIFF